MFLHIGENITIFKEDIVTIIDRKTLEDSKSTRQFIENMIEDGYLCNDPMEDAKTYILTCARKKNGRNKRTDKGYGLYVSNISSMTLFRRSKSRESGLEVK